MLIVFVNKFVKRLFRVNSQNILKVGVNLNAVLLSVLLKVLCTQHLGDFFQLIIIILAMEKGLLLKNNASK